GLCAISGRRQNMRSCSPSLTTTFTPTSSTTRARPTRPLTASSRTGRQPLTNTIATSRAMAISGAATAAPGPLRNGIREEPVGDIGDHRARSAVAGGLARLERSYYPQRLHHSDRGLPDHLQ